jgi:hypothetical protein
MNNSKDEAIRDFMAAPLAWQLLISLLLPPCVVGIVYLINKANVHYSKKLPPDAQPKLEPLRVYRNVLLVFYAGMIALTVYSNVAR